MSSVAVLTPESFAEHRSGLKDQEITGKIHLSSLTHNPLDPTPDLMFLFSSSMFCHVLLCGARLCPRG